MTRKSGTDGMEALNRLRSAHAFEKRHFALRTDFSLGDLEGDLVRLEDLDRRLDEADGSHVLTAGFEARGGGQGGRGGGRESHGGGGGRSGSSRGKRDGKGRPPQNPHYQQQQQRYQ